MCEPDGVRPLEDEPLIGDSRRWFSVGSHDMSSARDGKRWMRTYEERVVLFEADGVTTTISTDTSTPHARTSGGFTGVRMRRISSRS